MTEDVVVSQPTDTERRPSRVALFYGGAFLALFVALCAVGLHGLTEVHRQAQSASCSNDIHMLRIALQQYAEDHGRPNTTH